MNLTSIGDMAQGLMLRARTAELQKGMFRLTDELSSGQLTDVTTRLGGDFAYLIDINRNLAQLRAYSVSNSEARLLTEAAQLALGRIQDTTSDLSANMLTTIPSQLPTVLSGFSNQAEVDLQSVIAALNESIAGRSLFSGTHVDRVPIASADTLLTGLQTAISGLTDPGVIRSAAQTWFDDPTGFRATMYFGSDTALSPIKVGQAQQVNMTVMADDEAFRDVMRNLALSVLASDPVMALDIETRNDLMKTTAQELLSAQAALAAVGSEIGYAQSRIEAASARNEAQRTAFEYTKGTLTTADPFETATRLEEVQTQLENLYAATARTSRLSLLSFL